MYHLGCSMTEDYLFMPHAFSLCANGLNRARSYRISHFKQKTSTFEVGFFLVTNKNYV